MSKNAYSAILRLENGAEFTIEAGSVLEKEELVSFFLPAQHPNGADSDGKSITVLKNGEVVDVENDVYFRQRGIEGKTKHLSSYETATFSYDFKNKCFLKN